MSDQKVRQAIECGLAPCGYLMAFSLLISFDCYFQGVFVSCCCFLKISDFRKNKFFRKQQLTKQLHPGSNNQNKLTKIRSTAKKTRNN